MDANTQSAASPEPIDLALRLRLLVGDTGSVRESMGGFRIKIDHSRAFPYDEVFKSLLYNDFKVYVTRWKADLFIEAQM